MDIETYRTTVEQTYSYHRDGTPYGRLVEIVTDGTDYLGDRDSEEMSDGDIMAHNDWVEEVHDGYVALAKTTPGVRALAQGMLDSSDHGDEQAGNIRSCIDKAEAARFTITINIDLRELLDSHVVDGEVYDHKASWLVVKNAMYKSVYSYFPDDAIVIGVCDVSHEPGFSHREPDDREGVTVGVNNDDEEVLRDHCSAIQWKAAAAVQAVWAKLMETQEWLVDAEDASEQVATT